LQEHIEAILQHEVGMLRLTAHSGDDFYRALDVRVNVAVLDDLLVIWQL